MQGLFVAWCGRVEGMAMVVGNGRMIGNWEKKSENLVSIGAEPELQVTF